MPRLFLEWPVLSTYRLVPYVAYFSDVGSYSLHREVKASISLFKLFGSCPCTSHWPKAGHINRVIHEEQEGRSVLVGP